MDLLHLRHRAVLTTYGVEGRLLVGILAIAEVADLAQRERHLVRELHTGLGGEARRDRGVVGGGVREGLRGEDAAGLERDLAALPKLVEHRTVPLGPRDDDDMVVVLRAGPQKRDAANVDLVEEHRPALAARGGLGDPLTLELFGVLGIVAPGEERRMDLRMERLHAPAEEGRLLRDVLDRAGGDALGGEGGARAVRGDELPAEVAQAARERGKTGAIRNREEGSQRG